MAILTATDITQIQNLYIQLVQLQTDRKLIKQTRLRQVRGHTNSGEFPAFADFTPEAEEEIRAVLARDMQQRAAKIVEALHGYGCEATESLS